MDTNRPGLRAVIDTTVIAYYVLQTEPFTAEVHELWSKLREPLAPSSWQAELANTVWMTIRAGVITAEEGLRRLEFAAQLDIWSISTDSLWLEALSRSVTSGVSVYDTLFVELAARENLPLATYDTKVLAAFPTIARRPAALLKS